MTLSLSSRFSAERLPQVGQRVVYATSGIKLVGAGVVVSVSPLCVVPRVIVKLDSGAEATVMVHSLYEEPTIPLKGVC